MSETSRGAAGPADHAGRPAGAGASGSHAAHGVEHGAAPSRHAPQHVAPTGAPPRAVHTGDDGGRGALRSWLVLLLRLVVGGWFVWMGLTKAFDPAAFLKALRAFEMVPEQPVWVLNGIAAVMPWLEVWCGGLLVGGIAPRGAGTVVLVLLTAFTAAIAVRTANISAAEQIAFCEIAFDCGCGGGPVNACRKLAENTGLWIAALCVVCARRHRLAP